MDRLNIVDKLRNHIDSVLDDIFDRNDAQNFDRIYDFLEQQINIYLVAINARSAYYMDVPNSYDYGQEITCIVPENVKKIMVKDRWLFYNEKLEDDPDLKFLKENKITDEHSIPYYHTVLGRILGFIRPWIYPMMRKDEDNLIFTYGFTLPSQYNLGSIHFSSEMCNNREGANILHAYNKFQRFEEVIKRLLPNCRVDFTITTMKL